MRFVGRALLFAIASSVAAAVGFLVLAVGAVAEPAVQDIIAGLSIAGFDAALAELSHGDFGQSAEQLLVRLWTLSIALFLMPPALVGLIGEVLRLRSLAWYGVGCGALTAALPWLSRTGAAAPDSAALAVERRITLLLFVTGAAAGLTYWLLAGRTAGVTVPASRES